MKPFDIRLYLVTQRYDFGPDELLRRVEAAIHGGVTMVQLREKTCEGREFYEIALALRDLTRRLGVTLWINDRTDIALAVKADGIHLGQKDLPAKVVRKIIPATMLLGITASTVELARQAELDGADCIGCGAVFPTHTKRVKELGTAALTDIRNAVKLPIVAIGGINADNAYLPLQCGVNGIAVVSDIMQANDPRQAAENLRRIVDRFINA